jgi:hypothetical protein
VPSVSVKVGREKRTSIQQAEGLSHIDAELLISGVLKTAQGLAPVALSHLDPAFDLGTAPADHIDDAPQGR